MPSGGPSRRTSMHEGHRQSVTAVPARRRLLADVGPARVDAKTFDVARRPVRHLTPAPHQDRRARRRDEDNVTCSFADIVSRPRYLAFRSRANPAPRHLSDGAQRPKYRARPVNPQTFSTPSSGPLPNRMRCVHEQAKPETITRARSRAHRDRQSAALGCGTDN